MSQSAVHRPPPPSTQPKTQKSHFTQKFPGLNTHHYHQKTIQQLQKAYPKTCCGQTPSTPVKNRDTVLRCSKCHKQISITSFTPAHNLRLPLWTFGYLLEQAELSYPQVLTTARIQRILKLKSNKTATMLKRRLQLFLSDLQPIIKELMAEQLRAKPVKLPPDKEDRNIRRFIKNKPVVHADTAVMFTATRKANGYRARFKQTGSNSIFLTDEVAIEKGKWQIGSLVHTLTIPGGLSLFYAVSDQRQPTLKKHFEFLPQNSAVFTDEGYPWLKRERKLQHRAVNHSARAKDGKRFRWGRNRWSRGGINNNGAEAMQRVLKSAFAAYSYVTPEYMPLYLNEMSGLKAMRVMGGALDLLTLSPFGGTSRKASGASVGGGLWGKWEGG